MPPATLAPAALADGPRRAREAWGGIGRASPSIAGTCWRQVPPGGRRRRPAHLGRGRTHRFGPRHRGSGPTGAGTGRDASERVEYLFWSGEIYSAGRTAQFERRYDLPERVLPPRGGELCPIPSPPTPSAQLVRIAARAHGVATQQ